MQQTMVFVAERRREPLCFIKKMLAELARHRRARSFAGGIENRPEALRFVKKIHADHIFSVQNTWARRPFLYKSEEADALRSSGLGQSHDFANPVGVEALRL